MFNSKEEENSDDVAPKKKLSKLELEEEEEERKKAASADEKKKIIRNLIEKIPTAKDELFQFPVKMDMIDQVFAHILRFCTIDWFVGVFPIQGVFLLVLFH